MHLLLTGADGFVGKVIVPMLAKCGIEFTCAVSEPRHVSNGDWHTFNLLDKGSIDRLIEKVKPTHVLHLAGISHVPTSFEQPELTWQVNVMGTLSLLESLKRHSPECFFCFVSSSEVYGESFKIGKPLTEEAPLAPMNPYAASKAAGELLTAQYSRQGMKCVVLRPFNHIGAGQSEAFVTSAFAKQIAEIELDSNRPAKIQVGNLDAYRDFLHVSDVCRAYIAIIRGSSRINSGTTLNISSGEAVQIREILNNLLSMSRKKISVLSDESRMRPSDIPLAQGDNARIRLYVNWSPQVTLNESLSEVLEYWRLKGSSE